jgi:hypothetical protein
MPADATTTNAHVIVVVSTARGWTVTLFMTSRAAPTFTRSISAGGDRGARRYGVRK